MIYQQAMMAGGSSSNSKNMIRLKTNRDIWCLKPILNKERTQPLCPPGTPESLQLAWSARRGGTAPPHPPPLQDQRHRGTRPQSPWMSFTRWWQGPNARDLEPSVRSAGIGAWTQCVCAPARGWTWPGLGFGRWWAPCTHTHRATHHPREKQKQN